MKVNCEACKKVFNRLPSRQTKYCSRECMGLSKRKRSVKNCLQCGGGFESRVSSNRLFCSTNCKGVFQRSKEVVGSFDGKDLFKDAKGMVRIYHRVGGMYQYFHIYLAERAWGRLPRGHVVHHKDGNDQNNILENLEVLPSQAEHIRAHAKMRAERLGIVAGESLYCCSCKKVKAIAEFHSNKGSYTGSCCYCKECRKELKIY